jgi:hypothetical protein
MTLGADAHRIAIEVRNLMQLFNSLDPSPFHDRDLDSDAEEYIVATARDFPRHAPLTLTVHVHGVDLGGESEASVGRAIHNYFGYRAEATRRDLHYQLRQGRSSLVIGVLFLLSCMTTQQALLGVAGVGPVVDAVREGFIIIGWVAMWHPVQVFLYGWWPIREQQRLYEKLREMPVEVRLVGRDEGKPLP